MAPAATTTGNTPSSGVTESTHLLGKTETENEKGESSRGSDPESLAVSSSRMEKESKGGLEDETPSWREIMKKSAPFLRPGDARHSVYACLALFLVVTGKIVNVLPPLAIKYAVDVIAQGVADDAEKAEARHRVVMAIASFFGLKVLSTILNSAKNVFKRMVSLDAERRFGIEAFSHLQKLSLSYHLEKHIGEITRIMNRGTDSISSLIDAFA